MFVGHGGIAVVPTVTLAMIRYISYLCAGIKRGSGALRIVELQNYLISVHNFDSLHAKPTVVPLDAAALFVWGRNARTVLFGFAESKFV